MMYPLVLSNDTASCNKHVIRLCISASGISTAYDYNLSSHFPMVLLAPAVLWDQRVLVILADRQFLVCLVYLDLRDHRDFRASRQFLSKLLF